jgi:hypothetical protein
MFLDDWLYFDGYFKNDEKICNFYVNIVEYDQYTFRNLENNIKYYVFGISSSKGFIWKELSFIYLIFL